MLHPVIAQFITDHWTPPRPILLALSGGPDSLALLHLLHPHVPLQIAHVDHGWREESAAEANSLATLCQSLHLPFHTTRLSPCNLGNQEAAARAARLDYFRTLIRQHNFQAVVLGHHADDVAETTLKRFLEGTSLCQLNGLQAVTQWDELTLWRPLLAVRKEQILAFLRERNLTAFDDRTNHDSKYLRARMRLQMIPNLDQQFGKSIRPGICAIATEAEQLRDYLDRRTQLWLEQVATDDMAFNLDLSQAPPEPYELRHLLRRIAARLSLPLSRESLTFLVQSVMDNVANKRIVTGRGEVHVDRRRLRFLLKQLPVAAESFL